jgi:origin recognition complex subunit 3
MKELYDSKKVLVSMTDTVLLLQAIQQLLRPNSSSDCLSLYLQALSGNLQDSPTLREIFLAVKRAPSNILQKVLESIHSSASIGVADSVAETTSALNSLLRKMADTKEPLRSQHDIRNESMRTTVVAQKVELSRQKSKISEEDKAYSKILDEFHGWLTQYVDENLQASEDALFKEVLVFDSTGADRAVFMPRHRFAVERALSSPHDYLNCDCCVPSQDDGEGSISASLPSTALLYQLYLESGASINVQDLWTAFFAVVGDEDAAEDHEAVFLFQRALAELRHLGLVKSTRRKTDHIAKVSWRGL